MNIIKYKFIFLLLISLDMSAALIKDYVARYSFKSCLLYTSDAADE